jgi:hypothetical protein
MKTKIGMLERDTDKTDPILEDFLNQGSLECREKVSASSWEIRSSVRRLLMLKHIVKWPDLCLNIAELRGSDEVFQ